MRRRIFELLTVAVIAVAVVISNIQIAVASGGRTEVFFTVGSEEETAHMVDTTSTMGALSGENSITSGNIGRSIGAGQYVKYRFDLDDSMTAAVMKIYGNFYNGEGSNMNVYYSLSDSDDYVLMTGAGSIYKTGTFLYDLSGVLNLAAGNEFYIKIESLDTIVLYSVYVGYDYTLSGDSLTLTQGGINNAKYLYFTNLDCTYVHNSVELTYFMLNGTELVYKFDLPDDWTNAEITASELKSKASFAYSKDGSEYTAMSLQDAGLIGKALIDNPQNVVYIRMYASSNTIVSSFCISKSDKPVSSGETAAPGVGENTNKSVPENSDEVYFYVGTDSEGLYKVSTQDVSFDETHSGMDYDSANGGYANGVPKNSRKLDAGECVVYDFDLKDSITKGVLRIYGSAGLNVRYSLDEGVNYNNLPSARYTPYELGYKEYSLRALTALGNADKKFRIKISADSAGYFNELFIAEDKIQEINSSVYMISHNESMIRYMQSAQNNYTYMFHGKTPLLYLVGDGVSVGFAFGLPESRGSVKLISTLIKNGTATPSLYVSTDGTEYTRVMTAVSDGSNPTSQIADVTDIIGTADKMYIKVVSEGGASFLCDLGIQFDGNSGNEVRQVVYSDEEIARIESLSNTIYRYGDTDTAPLRWICENGSVVYRYNPSEGTDRLRVSLGGVGAYTIAFSNNAVDYVEENTGTIQSLSQQKTIDIYDIFENNPSDVLYIRIASVDQEGFALRGLTLTSTGVPDKPVIDAPDRDDDIVFDYTADGEPDYKGLLPDAIKEPEPVKIADPTAKGGCNGNNLLPVLSVILVIFGAFKIKR